MPETNATDIERYSRQVFFEPIGAAGQRRLQRARVTLIGCGALGTVVADTLVRAGVGFLRICDRDYIERDNLQRQVLFDESDVERRLPKAIAAVNKLRLVNSQVELEPVVTDVNHTNIERLTRGAELILDGTDNFETRYLINDVSIKTATPWIYAAVIGASGLVMPILPGEGPCLRCIFENAPPPEMSPTCDTAGVLGPAVHVVASFQTMQALKILAGKRDDLKLSLISIDLWSGRVTSLDVRKEAGQGACVCCRRGDYEYLEGQAGSTTTTLCGRDAIQIRPASGARGRVDFEAIAAKIAPAARGYVHHNKFMLTATVEGYLISVFGDGRAIIKGTGSPEQARSVYARYIGS